MGFNQIIRLLAIFNTMSFFYIYISVIYNMKFLLIDDNIGVMFLGLIFLSSLSNLLIFLFAILFKRTFGLSLNIDDTSKYILINIIAFSVYTYWGLGYDP